MGIRLGVRTGKSIYDARADACADAGDYADADIGDDALVDAGGDANRPKAWAQSDVKMAGHPNIM